jgi:tetratricopeptide (TPR) repeat protein
MSNKMSKDQLESDALVTGYAHTLIYFQQNKSLMLGAIAGIVLLISGSIGYYFYSLNQERAAQSFLGYAEQYVTAGDYETALNGSDAILGIGLEAIIASYGRTDAANLARYYAAVAKAEIGDAEKALDFMRGFKAPKGILGVGALAFHASLLDDAGRYGEAASKFRQAANWDVNPSTTPQNLLRAAQSAMRANDTRMAGQLVNEILTKYESSTVATSAQRLAGMLAAK